MESTTETKPWEILSEIIATNSSDAIKQFLDDVSPEDLPGVISHLDAEERTSMLKLLEPEDVAEMIDDLPWVKSLHILEDLDAKEAAAIITEMDSNDQADVLNEMDMPSMEAILDEMPDKKEVENIRKLIQYDPKCAGGLMITEYLAFEEDTKAGEVIKDLGDNAEQYERYNLQYIYVTKNESFVGVLAMRNLLLSKPGTRLSSIVITDAFTVNDTDSIDDLASFFDRYDFYGVPVVNEEHKMLGVVLRKHVREAQADIANIEHLETQGIVGGEELRTMPALLRSRRRLSWLSVNILLNIMAASIIAFYQETLSAVIALAVFLPIISDMSGCSGNQAVAVSLRELSLGVVRPFEVMRVWFQEVSVGLINGVVLGFLIGIAAWFWKGNAYLGLVAGGALAINTVVAVSLGGTIPLILKRYDIDPALASGPILTTVTDMMGFFLALTFASLMINYL